jgi:hypothetical protein
MLIDSYSYAKTRISKTLIYSGLTLGFELCAMRV